MAGAIVTDPSRRLTPVVRLAPAKLNLTLAVVGRRPDGFHDLHSVMVPLALADRLSLSLAAGRDDSLHVDGLDAGPLAANLVLRAIEAARHAVGAGWAGQGRPPALAARLEKLIPVAAGLAGGSSDAAAAIRGACEAWDADVPAEELLAVGAAVGSDVPFFLATDPPGAALVEGRGERVRRLRDVVGEPRPGILLVTPAVAVSTAAVFGAYAAGARAAGSSARIASEHLAGEMARGLSPRALLDRAAVIASANDLLPATLSLVPELVGFRRALARAVGRPVGQSGSGPTCFVIYPSEEEAGAAAMSVVEAVAGGRVPRVGGGNPTVLATTLATVAPETAGSREERES